MSEHAPTCPYEHDCPTCGRCVCDACWDTALERFHTAGLNGTLDQRAARLHDGSEQSKICKNTGFLPGRAEGGPFP